MAPDVRRALLLLVDPDQRTYFFTRLNNPDWVVPLHDEQVFRDPPGVTPAEEEGYVYFPGWPEGGYLARMAPLVPGDVARVLDVTDGNDNPHVARVLFEAAGDLPDSHVPDRIGKARSWLNTPRVELYADQAIHYLQRAIALGRHRRGFELLQILLAVRPDPQRDEKAKTTLVFGRPPLEPSARMGAWEYERILKSLHPLAGGPHGRAHVDMLSNLLIKALEYSRWPGEAEAGEYSPIWRGAIEDHEHNNDNEDIRNAIISTLRDATLAATGAHPAECTAIIEDLLSRSVVHQRVALYVLSLRHDDTDIAERYVGDLAFLDDHRFTHEISQLLDSRWDDLNETTRGSVLGWIDAGDEDAYREHRVDVDGEEPTDDDVAQHKKVWQRNKYTFVARHLTGEHKDRYDALVAELGAADHADFESWSATWSGSTSPDDAADMDSWPVERIVEYLATWEPPSELTWPPGPTIDGLGTQLTGITTKRAGELAEHAEAFADVDPTYIRGLIDGFEAAQREGTHLKWAPILRLAQSVAQRPFEPDSEQRDRERDPGYRWARRHILSLVQRGLDQGPNTIGWDHRADVWAVLELLTRDPNPSPNHEATYGGDNMDPLSLSLNSNRPQALHTVVRYGLWCHRTLTDQGMENPQANEFFPEILGVLDEHLDAITEPSQAIRSVYGNWYPWLLLLDETWAIDNAPKVFGPEGQADDLGQVAWDTYITRTAPYDSSWRALRPWYERAVSQVPAEHQDRVDHFRNPHHRLGEHLTTFDWRGRDDQQLTNRYFDTAPDVLAASVTSFVGRTLANTSELPDRIRARIQEHWDNRLPTLRANPEDHPEEIRAFSGWYASGKLEPAWAITRFEEAVQLAGAPRHAKQAIDWLAEDDTDPVAAARLLAAIVQRTNDPWENVIWRDPAKVILTRVTGNPAAVEDTRTVIDYFVRTGDQSFRELVPHETDPDIDPSP